MVNMIFLFFLFFLDVRYSSIHPQSVVAEFTKNEFATNALRALQGQLVRDFQLFVDYAKVREKEKGMEKRKEKQKEKG